MLDLDRYFARIGYAGETTATLPVLAAVVRAHMTSVPFENLDVLLGTRISLELDAVVAKLVDARRGGYCYEHSTLVQAVLERLGFAVAAHAARVTMTTPKDQAPRTHMLLSVDLPGGAVVVDPGFGTLAPTVPVPLDGTVAGIHWLERSTPGNEYTLKVQTPDRVIDAWVTPMTPEYPIDFVLANHYTSTYPTSAFTQHLMMRAFSDTGRVTIMDRVLTVTRDGVSRESLVADRRELRELLAVHFGLDVDVSALRVPSIPEWSS